MAFRPDLAAGLALSLAPDGVKRKKNAVAALESLRYEPPVVKKNSANARVVPAVMIPRDRTRPAEDLQAAVG
jgi:hypothetical protein